MPFTLLALLFSLVAVTPRQAPPANQNPKPNATPTTTPQKTAAPKPQTPAPSVPASGKPAPAPGAPASASTAPVIANTCEYVDPKDAAALLGPEASASTAPSKGALLSCGYTSPTGNTLTVSIADYGVPSVAQEFFAKTREALKTTTNEDSLGAPGFAFVATDAPARVDIAAVKDTQIVTIESSGPTAGTAQAVGALRAIMIKLLPKIAPPPAPAPTPPDLRP